MLIINLATGVVEPRDVPFARCGDNFQYANQTEAKKLGIDQYFCPSSRDFKVRGNSFSDTYEYFALSISKCEGASWAGDIDDKIKYMNVDIAVANTFFDFDDFEDPIKTYIDDRLYYDLLPGFGIANIAYVQ